MNPTKIEWATHVWNPVTGCKHGCPYCYARRFARRLKAMVNSLAAQATDIPVFMKPNLQRVRQRGEIRPWRQEYPR